MNIKKKIVRVLVSLLLLTSTVASASPNFKNTFDWQPVIDAIIQVESNGNPKAKSGNSVGAMQITPILVAQCNIILKERKSTKRYTLADRYSVAKSKEMFLLMQSEYNTQNNIEKAIRAWNGGNNYSVKRTQRYYEKVMKVLKTLKK
ncbi:MAG: lytic transglycosylase domain-containing protein [Prevotella sp.]|nr:lytic transglycosylase domain-containing protein [Prevotella sp.]MDD6753899.1 lytic transglycosylase domain-containing protein [Prevotella sp.]MDY3270895.1 lytic transglycosylase domain-containing protein [Prevotella sp.]